MTTRADIERRRGLTDGDYEWLYGLFNGCCWICKQPETIPNRKLAIDHDHATGAVRGLLCSRCNQVIGRMRDNSEWLRTAADYLDEARKAFSDSCTECDRLTVNAPTHVVRSDGEGSVFAYRCDAGHIWTCWYRTRGVPLAWKL